MIRLFNHVLNLYLVIAIVSDESWRESRSGLIVRMRKILKMH